MKKIYQSPVMMTVNMQSTNLLTASSIVNNVNVEIGGEGGQDDEAQSRRRYGWDDDDDIYDEENQNNLYEWSH